MSAKPKIARRLIAIGSLSVLTAVGAGACASGSDTDTSVGGAGGTGATDGGGTGGSSGSTGGTFNTGGTAGGAGMAGSSGAAGSGTGGTAGGAGAGGQAGAAGGTAGGAGSSSGGTGGGNGSEICNGLDDDMNGQIDDGDPGGGMACDVTTAQGVCRAGTTHCSTGNIVCQSNSQPSSEICDGLDNNCNGSTDEQNPGGNVACSTGLPGVCADGLTACTNGAIACNQTTQPMTEACNGRDDNCDGQVDEGNPGAGVVCTVGKPGVCDAGLTVCTNGQAQCVQQVQPSAEVCNGADDDCNGTIDDAAQVVGQACMVAGAMGACAPGLSTCTVGVPGCQATQNGPVAEKCDAIDNDCDGQVDDDPAASMCARSCNITTIPYAQTVVCNTGGTCDIAVCPPGRVNSDGDPCNGCETTTCVTSPTLNTCGTAQGITVGPASPQAVTGQLLTVGNQVFFSVTFSAPNPASGPTYKPSIKLTKNDGGDYHMDVLQNCSSGGTAATCPVAGSKSGGGGGLSATEWSMNYTYTAACTANINCTNQSTTPTIIARITRDKITSACNQFTVSFTQ